MANTKIEWTNTTWNPTTGCTKISPGCTHCYAEKLSKRLKAMGVSKYSNEFILTLHPSTLSLPLKWKKPSLIFVNSMSDLFHDDVPFEYISKVFDVMREAHWHTFQILTKRSKRLVDLNHLIKWPSNVWMGVTVETKEYIYRIDDLRHTNAQIKFLSLEPLLGPIPCINLDGIHWVIVGGESGPGARLIEERWVLDIRDQCINSHTLFFFKQWGGTRKKQSGRILQGKIWSETPKVELYKR